MFCCRNGNIQFSMRTRYTLNLSLIYNFIRIDNIILQKHGIVNEIANAIAQNNIEWKAYSLSMYESIFKCAHPVYHYDLSLNNFFPIWSEFLCSVCLKNIFLNAK